MKKKSLFKSFSLLFYLLFSFHLVYSQGYGDLYGKVLDSRNNPVSGATVQLKDRQFVTKNDGVYFFAKIAAGEYEILIRKDKRVMKQPLRIESGKDLEHIVFRFDTDPRQIFKNELGFENQIIPNVGINTYASLSPKGDTIAIEVFASQTNGFDIWLIDTRGKKIAEIVTSDLDESNPRWSSDGNKILYLTHSKKGYGIGIKNLSKDDPEFVDNGLTPAWSPSGSSIVYAKYIGSNCDIYRRDFATGTTMRLTNHSARDQYPYWGKINNSEKIVFASRRGDINNEIYEIWIMEPDGSAKRKLTDIGRKINKRMVGPVISPDGLKIAFWEIDYKNDHSIWVMNSDGTQPVELVKHGANPEWSPVEPNVLYFNSKITGRSQIWKTQIQ